ncbi:MAG: transglutaminase domain-containing protein [Phycisphaerae bacterium]|nr:transglutaminase-like domain-containing protein [Phycisphaerae bacterium]NUQ47990.1 transglutaminase domain-containing protein [Phycisphaerae bacterium]
MRPRSRRSRPTFTLAALVLAAVASYTGAEPPVDLGNPPQGVFIDDWFIIELQGGKAGHGHTTVTRDGDRITSRTDLKLAIRRGEAEVRMNVEQESRELVDGTPVGFEHTMTLANVPVRMKGKIRNGKVRITEEQFGVEREKTYPFDPATRLTWGLLLEQHKHGLKPGTKYNVLTYEPSLRPDAPIETRVEVIGPEDVDVLGRRIRATRVRQIVNIAARPDQPPAAPGPAGAAAAAMMGTEITSDAWVDDQLSPVRMDTLLGGLQMRMLRASRAEAEADGKPPELFLSLFVPLKGKLKSDARRVVYKFSVSGAEPLPDLPTTDMQRFERIDDRSARLIVKRSDWNALRKAPPDAPDAKPPADVGRFLEASLYADARDTRIKSLTERAIKNAASPAERADKLRRFVSEYVSEKNLSTGFATASEVAESREGDCTEHAVLLAAMARAAGIPARGVGGIVRVPSPGGQSSDFGYHMWTQVWLHGRWIDIDAALRQTECDVTHIAMTILDLNESSLADASLQLLPLMGRLSMEALETDK